MATEMLQIELRKLDIDVSPEMILAKRSRFNPYPEQASQGILVHRMFYLSANPQTTVKYVATGKMYSVSVPSASESAASISAPQEIQGNPGRMFDDNSWMSFDEFLGRLSKTFVEYFFAEHADLEAADALVSRYTAAGPVFYQPKDAFVNLIKLAEARYAAGDYFSSALLFDIICHQGAHTINGEDYFDPAYALFEYTTWQMAIDYCPLLTILPEATQHDGRFSIINETAAQIQALIDVSLKLKSYEAYSLQTESAVRKFYLRLEIEKLVASRSRIINDLNTAHTNGVRHLPMIQGMSLGHGIRLLL